MAKIIRKPLRPVPTQEKQDYVRYCPNCRGDLRIPSPAEKPHRYQCGVCEREFEVNDLYMESVIQ
jgi:hypothetical protein